MAKHGLRLLNLSRKVTDWTLPRVHRVGLSQGRVAMGRRQRKSSYSCGASSVLGELGESLIQEQPKRTCAGA